MRRRLRVAVDPNPIPAVTVPSAASTYLYLDPRRRLLGSESNPALVDAEATEKLEFRSSADIMPEVIAELFFQLVASILRGPRSAQGLMRSLGATDVAAGLRRACSRAEARERLDADIDLSEKIVRLVVEADKKKPFTSYAELGKWVCGERHKVGTNTLLTRDIFDAILYSLGLCSASLVVRSSIDRSTKRFAPAPLEAACLPAPVCRAALSNHPPTPAPGVLDTSSRASATAPPSPRWGLDSPKTRCVGGFREEAGAGRDLDADLFGRAGCDALGAISIGSGRRRGWGADFQPVLRSLYR